MLVRGAGRIAGAGEEEAAVQQDLANGAGGGPRLGERAAIAAVTMSGQSQGEQPGSDRAVPCLAGEPLLVQHKRRGQASLQAGRLKDRWHG